MCPRCVEAVPVITPPLCSRCGRPTEEPVRHCPDCPPRPIHAARAPFLYAGSLAPAVRALKFAGWRALAPSFASAMAEVSTFDAECLTWVPLSRRRRAARGFDQAEVLARELGKRLRMPAVGLLKRTQETTSQASRSGMERRQALRGAFLPRGDVPASVVLVDDVLTTGVTAATCAAALRRAGARSVCVLTAARSIRGAVPARCFAIIPAGSRLGLWLPGGTSPGSRCQPQAKRPT
jgi:competence protein ComFC